MDCKEFREYLPDFLEGELGSHLVQSMKDHLLECSKCSDIYEKNTSIREDFNTLKYEHEFKSQRESIMARIDKDKYKSTYNNKMKHGFLNHRKPLAIAASVIFVLALSPLVLNNIRHGSLKKSNLEIANYSEKDAGAEKAEGNMEAMDNGVKAGVRGIMPSREEGMQANSLGAELEKLKTMPIGVGPWVTIHSANNNVVFYNYSHVVAYDYAGGSSGIYSVIDLRNFDVGSYQGGTVVDFNVSPDGNYMVMGSSNGDEYEKNKPLYLVEFVSGTSTTLFDSLNMIPTRIEWSKNSRYVLIQGEEDLLVYDVESKTEYRRKENSGDKYYISNNGDMISSKGDLYSKEKNYSKTTSYNINVIGYGEGYVIEKEGSKIYYNDFKNKRLITEVGNAEFYGIRDRNIILSDGKTNNVVINIDSSEAYRYSTHEIYRLSPKGSKLIDINISNMDNGTINLLLGGTKTSQLKKIVSNEFMNEYVNFRGEDKLITVKFNSNAKSLGDFKIVEYDINSLKASILYENK